MGWLAELLNRLADRYDWPYAAGGPGASEPTALAALALAAGDRKDAALRAGQWLADRQGRDGAVGITAGQARPAWPTSLALLAWQRDQPVRRATALRNSSSGPPLSCSRRADVSREPQEFYAHDPRLVGWPWVAGTHSWLEPTAWAVLALKARGLGEHPRVREAVQLLVDRQLPGGGCNYGNTIVFGHRLRAHHQPTGLALMALADEPFSARREQSAQYLRRCWPDVPGSVSMCFVAMGLAAVGTTPHALETEMQRLYRLATADGSSPYRMALISLAALGRDCPLIPRPVRLSANVTVDERSV